MKKLLLVTAIVSALGASYAPMANAASSGDVAAGALVGGILGYAMGQSNNSYNTYGYTTPAYGYSYGYTPGYNSYYGYEAPVTSVVGTTCAGLYGSRPVTDSWGNTIGVQCPNGAIQYY